MTEPNAIETKPKITRHRSPAYPSLSLREAVQKAEAFYRNHGIHRVSLDAAAKGWSFEGVSGVAGRAISALKQFGLLSEEEENGCRLVRLSDLGRKIVQLSADDPRRQEAISGAARKPTIHRDLLKEYPTRLPEDDAPMKSYLEYERKFNRNAIEPLIKEIRDTWAFALLEESGTMSQPNGEEQPPSQGYDVMTTNTAKPGGSPPPQQIPETRVQFVELQIPDVGGHTSILRTATPETVEEFDYLRGVIDDYLEAWKKRIEDRLARQSEREKGS